MKKNLKIVQINGFRGLFLTLFILTCLIAGFIAFPAFVSMNIWNYLAVKTGSFNTINFGGGTLLWGIILLSSYMFSKKKFILSYNSQQELTDEEVKEVISKIKNKTTSPCIIKPKDINDAKEQDESVQELQTNSKDN